MWSRRNSKHTNGELFFLIRHLWGQTPIHEIVRQQYYLAKCGISLLESSMLPDFEREAYINMYIKEKKEEAELFKKMNTEVKPK